LAYIALAGVRLFDPGGIDFPDLGLALLLLLFIGYRLNFKPPAPCFLALFSTNALVVEWENV